MSESSSGGKTIFKLFLGCGCAALLVFAVVTGVTVYASYLAYEKVRELTADVSVENFDPSKFSDLKKRVLPEGYDIDLGEIGEAITRPADKEDFDRFVAADAWFYEQPAHKEAAKAVKAVSGGSFLETITEQKDLLDSHEELIGLMKDFNQYISKNGGYTKQVDSAVRAVGVAGAADVYARATKKDAASKAVAQELGEVSAKARNAADGSDDRLLAIGKEFGLQKKDLEWAKPGLIAMAKMPNGSFEAWRNLSKLERERVMAAYARQADTVLAAQLNPILKTRRFISELPVQ